MSRSVPLIIRLARFVAGEAAPKERVRVLLRAIQTPSRLFLFVSFRAKRRIPDPSSPRPARERIEGEGPCKARDSSARDSRFCVWIFNRPLLSLVSSQARSTPLRAAPPRDTPIFLDDIQPTPYHLSTKICDARASLRPRIIQSCLCVMPSAAEGPRIFSTAATASSTTDQPRCVTLELHSIAVSFRAAAAKNPGSFLSHRIGQQKARVPRNTAPSFLFGFARLRQKRHYLGLTHAA